MFSVNKDIEKLPYDVLTKLIEEQGFKRDEAPAQENKEPENKIVEQVAKEPEEKKKEPEEVIVKDDKNRG